MFKPEKAVPVACTSPAWVMVNHLATAKHANTNYNKPALFIRATSLLLCSKIVVNIKF